MKKRKANTVHWIMNKVHLITVPWFTKGWDQIGCCLEKIIVPLNYSFKKHLWNPSIYEIHHKTSDEATAMSIFLLLAVIKQNLQLHFHENYRKKLTIIMVGTMGYVWL